MLTSSTLPPAAYALFTVAHLGGARHTARHRWLVIRHLILQRKPVARHCTAKLRCSAILSHHQVGQRWAARVQILHCLAVSLLSLSFITLSNHSPLLVHLCLHSLRHSLLLLSTHSDILYCSCLYSPQTVFTTLEITMATNWGLLLGLIFAVLACSIAIAFLIAYCYNRFIRPAEEVEELNEKHLSLPRPATAPTVPDTPITGTAIQFNFSRPVWTSRLSLPKRLSQFTIPEHMAAGAIPEHSAADSVTTPARSHFRSHSGWTPQHRRNQSRAQHSRGRSRQIGDFIMPPAYIQKHQRNRPSMHSRTTSGHTRLGSG